MTAHQQSRPSDRVALRSALHADQPADGRQHHEWVAAAVWEKLERMPGFNEQMQRARERLERGEGIPMSDLRKELGLT